MSLIWLNCLRQLKDDVEKDKKNMEKLKEIKDVTCFLYMHTCLSRCFLSSICVKIQQPLPFRIHPCFVLYVHKN